MKHILKNLVISVILIPALLFPACSKSSPERTQTSTSAPLIECNWETVNQSVERYPFGVKYYLPEDYKEEEKEYNCISIYNYDPSREAAFKSVDCQIMLSYGQTDGYDVPMVTIALVDNRSESAFSCFADRKGSIVRKEGTWFLDAEETERLFELNEDAKTIFGLR